MSNGTLPQSSSTNSRLVLLSTLLVGIVATFVVVYALTNRPRAAATPTVDYSQNFDGVRAFNPARQVQDFTLVSQNEKPVSLSSFKGKMVLMFFGFTNCQDVCPITLMQFKQVRQQLGDKADQVALLFVSVDPKRDTPSVIGDYLKKFDPTITGLVGDMDVFENVKNDYDLQFIEVPSEDGNGGSAYSVSHTPNPFLIDANGKLVASYAYGTDVKLIVNDISSRISAN